jgi:hypothetical protein
MTSNPPLIVYLRVSIAKQGASVRAYDQAGLIILLP